MVRQQFLTVFLAAILSLVSAAAVRGEQREKDNVDGNKHPALQKARAAAYAIPGEARPSQPGARAENRRPLGVTAYSSATESPGVPIGYTWYDWQHNCSMGRMVETGPHSEGAGPAIVHFGWMYLPQPYLEARSYAYNAYVSAASSFTGVTILHEPFMDYSGYVNVDVTPNNRALVGGHLSSILGPQDYQTQIHWDACSACADFWFFARIPDSVASYDRERGEAMWPKFFLQYGTDTVLHVVAKVRDQYEQWLEAITYFRKVSPKTVPSGDWDYPPYVIDSLPNYSHDIAGVRDGDRVALVWTANLPYQEPFCDTCSGASVYIDELIGQMDNDLYYQMSNNQGLSWQPRVNLTQVPIGAAGYKPYCDLSVLFDSNDYLHVVWNAVPWPADTCIDDGRGCFTEDFYPDKCRIFHWSENVPVFRTVCDHTYIPSAICGPPAWAATVAKMGLAQCDNKLYTIWTQFNDVRNGIYDDCAEWGFKSGKYTGAANGDIWVAISEDWGLTWDYQRNLTDTRTPHCDPNYGIECESDYWPSITRYGRQVETGEYWSAAQVVDPSEGASPTDWYLDVMYVNDRDAGGVVVSEGSWTYNQLKWFRLQCVEPVLAPFLIVEWTELGYPAYVRPGESLDTALTFENIGNLDLSYTITVIEDNGPTGWLGYSGFTGTLSCGVENKDTGMVHLNQGGLITDVGNYYGRLHIEGNDPHNLPMDIEIELVVTESVAGVVWDVVSTGRTSLIVSNHGNMGKLGNNGAGTVNMDYYDFDPDCNLDARIYLYDGSPLVGRILGDDTVFNWAIWGTRPGDDYSLLPQGDHIPTVYSAVLNAEVFESGTIVTGDSTIALEKIWTAPHGDGVHYVIEYMRVWSFDGQPHDDVMLGEAVDWNIPETHLNTDSVIDYENSLLQYGYDTSTAWVCVESKNRVSIVYFKGAYLNGLPHTGDLHGGFILKNDSLRSGKGFRPGALYCEMAQPGLRDCDSIADLHSVITFEKDLDLGATDVYETVTVLGSNLQYTLKSDPPADPQEIIDSAIAWYTANGGISMFEDLDGDGQIDVCGSCCSLRGDLDYNHTVNSLDLIYFVDWLWKGGAAPPCRQNGDANGNDQTDAIDLLYLVAYMWQGGPDPVPCP
ncbi:MAG: hypothetical protein JSW34_11330 [Candidatus Zixiibacteriota bacterium]|nr:MAG: hypothetical protein JSW34_11330 [candidate division Zixibacteria bacterium]